MTPTGPPDRQGEAVGLPYVLGRVWRLSPLIRYGIAIAAAAAGTSLRLALDPLWGFQFPLMMFFPAIMVSAWFGGLGPGIVTTLLSAVAADYFWMTPMWSLAMGWSDAVGLLAFVGVGGLMSGLNEVWRRAERERDKLLESERAARDDTERAHRDAGTAAEHLRLALEAGRMGTWQYTIGTGAVKWSPGLEAIHGFAPGSFPGTFDAFRNEIHPADHDRVLEAIGAAVEQRRDHHVEYRIVRADGTIRWVEGRGQLFCDDDGRPERMVGVCVDVTERKQAEEERAQLLVREQAARADVERASRLKDEFLAVLSHELRTPLNAVLGYGHLLSSKTLSPDRAAHALEAIQRNAQAQARLVESLLDLSRIMAGKLELERDRVDLSSVLHAAVDVVRPAADSKGLVLDVVAPPSSLTIVGDGGRLQQVLWNLLANAVKFTPQGGRIAIRLARVDSQAHIRVSDSGQGISAEFLPHVFDRFMQAGSAEGRPQAGLGLGLTLVRELVQAHGGTVVAESPGEGQGSTFTVTLPAPAPAAGPHAPQGIPGRTAGASDAAESLPHVEVLIVDDDGDTRDWLGFMLESRGAVVRTVSSAGEALEAISARRPDVLLADLRMPQEDGFTMIHKLRARERAQNEPRLPAIAVTAYASPSDRERAIAAGYDRHIAKPVETGELSRAIAMIVKIQEI